MENINAESMRAANTKSLDSILAMIGERVGCDNLYLPDFGIKNADKLELESRGFKVEIGGRYNETNTKISW